MSKRSLAARAAAAPRLTRQVARAAAFAVAWSMVVEKFGGGRGWTGADCMPRRNRRRIARKVANAAAREAVAGQKPGFGETERVIRDAIRKRLRAD